MQVLSIVQITSKAWCLLAPDVHMSSSHICGSLALGHTRLLASLSDTHHRIPEPIPTTVLFGESSCSSVASDATVTKINIKILKQILMNNGENMKLQNL